MNEVGVTFTLDQLWALNDLIRHESSDGRAWAAPPVSLALNEKVADAILVCEESKPFPESQQSPTNLPTITEYTIELSHGDCLCIDYNVRQGMKSANGLPIGKQILLKAFAARREITDGFVAVAVEPVRTPEYIEAQMAEWRKQDADSSPDQNANNLPE